MSPKFELIFLEEARTFLANLDKKTQRKVIYNLDKARFTLDPELFKKLNNDVWEFRTRFNKQQIRMLAFWDKRDGKNTLVIITHGIVKKQGKVPAKEIEKAVRLKEKYFSQNN
ncbi:MAG: type II toxin-antitoxin system RelE/ParE family toxin [Bacteroidota bacterium]